MKKKKRKTKRERVEEWLIENKQIINISGLESKALFPRGTLHKFIKYDRKISNERINQLDKIIKDIVYKYIEDED